MIRPEGSKNADEDDSLLIDLSVKGSDNLKKAQKGSDSLNKVMKSMSF